jgi:hypothetical protein
MFKDYAPNYFEAGFSIIPTTGKSPIIKDWSKYCSKIPTEGIIHNWIRLHGDKNIGLPLGPYNKMVAVDVDVDDMDLLKKMPPTPLVKRGRKGKTFFYKFQNQASTIIKANGKPIADFLSTGKQTIIPPSIHPDTQKPYTWGYETLESVDVDDLPVVTAEEIQSIVNQHYSISDINLDLSSKGSRNNSLKSKLGLLYNEGYNVDEAIKAIIDFDLHTHGSAEALFLDKKEFPHCTQLQAATKFTKSVYQTIFKNEQNKKADAPKKEKKKQLKYDDYKAFFEEILHDAKKDFLTDKLMSLDSNGIWQPIINNIDTIRSYAIDAGLNQHHVKIHFDRYVQDITSQWLIDIPEWDGRDRIHELRNYISFKNVEFEVFEDLFKQWCALVFAKLNNSDVQNRLCLFKGDQGIGKDILIQNLFRALGQYFNSVTIGSKETDNYGVMSRNVLLYINEFDRIARVNVATIKDIITSPSANYRVPYGHDYQTSLFRCSFISTCNKDDILRDETGNRRFLIFDIDKINWNYPKGESLQIIAQMRQLYNDNYIASKEAEKIMSDYIIKESPDNMIDEVVSALHKQIIDDNYLTMKREGIERIPLFKCQDSVAAVAKKFGLSIKRVQIIAKKSPLYFKSNGKLYYQVNLNDHDLTFLASLQGTINGNSKEIH